MPTAHDAIRGLRLLGCTEYSLSRSLVILSPQALDTQRLVTEVTKRTELEDTIEKRLTMLSLALCDLHA